MWRYLTSRIPRVIGQEHMRVLSDWRYLSNSKTHIHARIKRKRKREGQRGKLGTSNRHSWIKLRAFRAENVSGSAMLSATTTNATVVPHAARRRKYTYISKSLTKASLYPACAYSGASLENGSVGPQRARTLVSSPARARSLRWTPTTNIADRNSTYSRLSWVRANDDDGSDFRGIEIVSRESSTAFRWNSTLGERSLRAIFHMRVCCATDRKSVV